MVYKGTSNYNGPSVWLLSQVSLLITEPTAERKLAALLYTIIILNLFLIIY